MVNVSPKFVADLVDRMDPTEHCRVRETVAGVVELVHHMQGLRPLEPDRAWLKASKRRLVARFESLVS